MLTKAETLKKLSFYFNVPKLIYFEKNHFEKDPSKIISKIKNLRKDIIIRSSAKDEDGKKISNAGKYESIISQKGNRNLIKKIKTVSLKLKNNKDQIIIQNFIKNPDFAGVIFTSDKNSNSPYITIDYDRSGKSNLITSGSKNITQKKIIINKITNNSYSGIFSNLLKITYQLEKIFNNERLDIEFCIKGSKVFILQCRSLSGSKKKINPVMKKKLISSNINLKKKLNKLLLKKPNLSGRTSIFSNMADWNPAEMIGHKPDNLSISLYMHLITDNVWREQRDLYGYKNVEPYKLMFSFLGAPYIDVRVDLNSFLPKNLPKNISEKIINNSLNKLKKNPNFHDKIEFNIIETCYNFSILRQNYKYLNNKEFKIYINKLKELTKDIYSKKKDFKGNELKKIKNFKKELNKIQNSNLSYIEKIYFITQITKKFGTLPFAGIARLAFICKSILDSFVKKKLIKENEIDEFYKCINSIGKNIKNDHIKYKEKKISKKQFLNLYGHIRPSTYDICSKNYAENFKKYFSNQRFKDKIKKTNLLSLLKFNNHKSIDYLLKKNLNININNFLNFSKKAIELREEFKNEFSKGINCIFENIISLGKEMKIDRKDMRFIKFETLVNSYSTLNSKKLKEIFKKEINENKSQKKLLDLIKLPDVIRKEQDIDFYYDLSVSENYITNQNIISEIVNFKNEINFHNFNNKIILIESADPGYDFIFSYEINGLITKYGGSNSHMAIRCLELNIPAIIGVGEKLYEKISKSKNISIDCFKKKIDIIN